MKRRSIAAALLLGFVFTISAFSQSSNGSVGGIVQDPSGALIPGVTITLTNTGTGIINTTVSNESGAYSFPSASPGTYKASASLPGFRTSVFSDVGVGNSAQVRLDFKMQLGEVATQALEVSVGAQQLLTESSATIGTVLPQSTVRDLPLIGGDVLTLINIMPGVVGNSFAGVAGININTTRDGLPVADQRFDNGVFGTTMINPDLVGEVRIILAPVDVEMGRQHHNLNSNCTLSALARRNPDGSTGPVVLQNPKPGTRGTLGQNFVELPGTYRFDASLSKTFRISESKALQVRLDATNVLNHADPGTPTLSLSDAFGDIAAKGTQVRNFQGQLRFTF